jgi:hypothetical protein
MALNPPDVVTDWVVDSSASNHTTNNDGNIPLFCPPIQLIYLLLSVMAPSSILSVTSVGDSVLSRPFYPNNIFLTPNMIQNLLSVHRFTTDNSCSMEFNPFDVSVKDLASWNVVIRSNSSSPLYTAPLRVFFHV